MPPFQGSRSDGLSNTQGLRPGLLSWRRFAAGQHPL